MTAPRLGTPEYELWAEGARDEYHAERDGLSEEVIKLVELIQSLGQRRRSCSEVIGSVARIYRSEMSWRERLSLAWDLLH